MNKFKYILLLLLLATPLNISRADDAKTIDKIFQAADILSPVEQQFFDGNVKINNIDQRCDPYAFVQIIKIGTQDTLYYTLYP